MDLLRIFCLFFVLIVDVFVELKMNPLQCPQIQINHGRVRYRQRGRFAKFVCNVGYILAGERYSTCAKGEWEVAPPRCVRPTCISVKPPANGLIYPSHGGAVLNFFCKSNFHLRGPRVAYCDGRKWDSALPSCLPTNSTPPLSCDFETDDLCGWNHDLNHDFDWRRMNFNTPSGSIGTGPSYDHTKGEGKDGYYMYIESSSRNENDTARLISPIYNKTSDDTCLEFFYHMYGVTTGSLRVYVKKFSEEWWLDPTNAVFDKRGNQGDRWYRAFVDLGTINEDFQIVFEGVRGPGYVSDIAIDDVKIIEHCVVDEWSTTTEIQENYSEPSQVVESCENRCYSNDTEVTNGASFLIACDCDEGCTDRNRCCPDYLDYCVLSVSSDDGATVTDQSSTPESSSYWPTEDGTTVADIDTTIIVVNNKLPKLNLTSNTRENTIGTTRSITLKKSMMTAPVTTVRASTMRSTQQRWQPQPPTNKSAPQRPVIKLPPQLPTKKPTPQSPVNKPAPQPPVNKPAPQPPVNKPAPQPPVNKPAPQPPVRIPITTKRPPLVILTRPTTTKIYQYKQTKKPQIIYVKPDKDLSNDIVEVPPPPNKPEDSEEETPAAPLPTKPDRLPPAVIPSAPSPSGGDYDETGNSEDTSDELSNDINIMGDETSKYVKSDKQPVIIDNEDKSQSSHVMRTAIFAVGVVFGILLGLVGMAFGIRRYLRYARSRSRYGGARYSASKRDSDVIYLTSDEHLDMDLQQEYYDTL